MIRMHPCLHALATALLLLACQNAGAASFEDCLLDLARDPDNAELTVAELHSRCQSAAGTAVSAAPKPGLDDVPAGQPGTARFSEFFEPYKNSYLLFGSMRNRQGGEPFSGKTLDIKFELGLKFRLFPERPGFEKLQPLYFGYAQKSWWDIAESSAPFREHNYNPELFWDYSKTSNRNGFNFIGQFIDRIGYEHQSNGRDGDGSRSWDRLYLQRDFRVSNRLSLGFKAWNLVNVGELNRDITDYMGDLRVDGSFRPNDRLTVKASAWQGRRTSKLTYQLDFIYSIPEWVNSQFMLSYHDGYGDALVSYNQKTTSLRAGLYFPVSLGGN